MGKRKGAIAEGLQKEFDRYIKITISNVVDHVIKKYANSQKKQWYTICVSDPGEYACRGKKISWYMQSYPSEKDSISDERLLAGLARLGETYRVVIELGILEDMPNQAVAELMELSEKTVRNYKSDALRILKHYLEDVDDEEKGSI